MVPNGVSFVSLQTLSGRADELIRKQKDKLAHNASTYPPGLKEQYKVQLKLLEDPNVPDVEFMFFPFMIHFFPNPEPQKPYINMVPMLCRPFSRGTIVRAVSSGKHLCRELNHVLAYHLC